VQFAHLQREAVTAQPRKERQKMVRDQVTTPFLPFTPSPSPSSLSSSLNIPPFLAAGLLLLQHNHVSHSPANHHITSPPPGVPAAGV
jgi:hypothetical protein